jgi:hypothetical protein
MGIRWSAAFPRMHFSEGAMGLASNFRKRHGLSEFGAGLGNACVRGGWRVRGGMRAHADHGNATRALLRDTAAARGRRS